MNISLEGKVALVTGSSRGIGAELVKSFAQHGANVIINYVKSEKLAHDLAEEMIDKYNVDCIAVKADVTKEEDVERLLSVVREEFDRVDILVNNALHSYRFDPDQRKLAWEIDWDDYQQQIDGSLKASFLTCKYSVPLMKENSFGRIVNMISNLVHRPVVPYHDYTTAKGALLSFSQNLAVDLGPFGITVNCVAPGIVYPTEASKLTKEEVKDNIIEQTPLGRIAKPNDIVGSVLFFGSEWSQFITGQNITVDGGFTMK
jgi:3-oxoacyl-[acyl-carrier protein] reductase